MADIRLRIEVNPNGETEFGKNDGVEKIGNIINDNAELSNVSYKTDDTNIFNITTVNENGREMLSWANNGVLQFNSDGLLSTDGVVAGALASETDPDMFVWGAVPESKQYSVKLTFSKATSLKDIVVYGDKTANQFPTKAIVDGTKTIYSDDYQWAINMETESDTHTIEFVEWNRANYNACLTRIMVMLRYFDLDKGWIDSVESLTQSTSDPSSIQYGVLANSGSATIRDLDGELKDYVQDEVIDDANVGISLIVNNNEIQRHLTSDTDYIGTEKQLKLSLTNKIQELSNISFGGRQLSDETTLYSLFNEILGENGLGYTETEIDDMLSTQIIYGENNTFGTIKSYLQTISIPYPYLQKSTYREALDKLCEIAQLNLLMDNNNCLKFISARPVISETDKQNAIKIPKSLQLAELSTSIIKKNKYNNVFVPTTTFSGGMELFGETKSIVLEAEEDYMTKKTDSSTSTVYYVSEYEEVYNYEENPYNGNTEIVEITSYGSGSDYLTSAFYKTHITFDLSASEDALLVKDFDNIYLSIDGLVKGSNSVSTPSGATFNYLPYKTRNKTTEIQLKNYTIGASTTIATTNLVIANNIISFDLYMFKEKISQSGFWVVPNINSIYISATLQLKGEVFSYNSTENTSNITPELNQNELLQNNAKQESINLTDLIKNNILVDYKNGIATANINIFISNLYNSQGQLVKNWQKGEVIDVGDIVYFENDKNADSTQRYWRVTGRKFNYSGSPTLSLELQEVKVVE